MSVGLGNNCEIALDRLGIRDWCLTMHQELESSWRHMDGPIFSKKKQTHGVANQIKDFDFVPVKRVVNVSFLSGV